MVERQPGRPTEQEFIGAACRFSNDDYQVNPVHVQVGFFMNVIMMQGGKSHDIDIIRRERAAAGLPGWPESLEDFAVRQLAAYQRHRSG